MRDGPNVLPHSLPGIRAAENIFKQIIHDVLGLRRSVQSLLLATVAATWHVGVVRTAVIENIL